MPLWAFIVNVQPDFENKYELIDIILINFETIIKVLFEDHDYFLFQNNEPFSEGLKKTHKKKWISPTFGIWAP